ncbi:hypothetical protein ACO0SA_001173 [Hanseniaspora valbyensis]
MVFFSFNTQRRINSKDNNKSNNTDIASVLLCSVVLAATLISLYSGFNRYVLRYEQAADIPKIYFQNRQSPSNIGKNGKWLYGKVLSVGDGDNLNFYHMPGGFWGGWGIIRREPKLKLNIFKQKTVKKQVNSRQDFNPLTMAWNLIKGDTKTTNKKKTNNNSNTSKKKTTKAVVKKQQYKNVNFLNKVYTNWFTDGTTSDHFMSLPIYYTNNYKHKTISIRLCGIDAPERSHFGSKAQPFSDEAMNFLKHTLLNKKIYVKPLEIDRYGRCVARVLYYDGFFRQQKDISLEMLKVGLATIYESKSPIDFDGQELIYKKAETDSKKKKRGMWRLKKLETPAEFKKKLRS